MRVPLYFIFFYLKNFIGGVGILGFRTLHSEVTSQIPAGVPELGNEFTCFPFTKASVGTRYKSARE